MAKKRKPWDQCEGESGPAYARFLLYRNLGPCRSMLEAYFRYLQRFDGYTGTKKGLNIPYSWRQDAKRHEWVDRAASWDVKNLQRQGAAIAALHASTIRRLAARSAAMAKKVKPGDDGYGDFLTTVRTVGAFLTPELVKGVQERYRPAHRTAAPTGKEDGVE